MTAERDRMKKTGRREKKRDKKIHQPFFSKLARRSFFSINSKVRRPTG